MEQKPKHIIWWESQDPHTSAGLYCKYYPTDESLEFIGKDSRIKFIYDQEHPEQKPQHVIWWESLGKYQQVLIDYYFNRELIDSKEHSDKNILYIYEKEHPTTEIEGTLLDSYSDNDFRERDGDREGEELPNVAIVEDIIIPLRAENERLSKLLENALQQSMDNAGVAVEYKKESAALQEAVGKMLYILIPIEDLSNDGGFMMDNTSGLYSQIKSAIQEAEKILNKEI